MRCRWELGWTVIDVYRLDRRRNVIFGSDRLDGRLLYLMSSRRRRQNRSRSFFGCGWRFGEQASPTARLCGRWSSARGWLGFFGLERGQSIFAWLIGPVASSSEIITVFRNRVPAPSGVRGLLCRSSIPSVRGIRSFCAVCVCGSLSAAATPCAATVGSTTTSSSTTFCRTTPACL